MLIGTIHSHSIPYSRKKARNKRAGMWGGALGRERGALCELWDARMIAIGTSEVAGARAAGGTNGAAGKSEHERDQVVTR